MPAPFFRLPFALPALSDLAIPVVCTLIFFLAYSSQYLFYYIEPGPLSRTQAILFNVFVLCIWICYDRACTTDAAPRGWVRKALPDIAESDNESEVRLEKGVRWCKKCEAVKPPRAHHCRKCGNCIPKMDHHCPWTANCVSQTTFPHFLRFVFYAVVSMSILAYHLFIRLWVLWENRNLPAYLGPSAWALAHLMILFVVNGVVLFGLGILVSRVIYGMTMNTTMIESWEIERHEALVNRARKTGGYVYANGGQRIRIEQQEFPYDIGIWKNICQSMGTSNLLMWFFPFGGEPGVETAGKWEVNGFEDDSKIWPPPDPDKMSRGVRHDEPEVREYGSVEEQKEAFFKRQQDDLKKRGHKKRNSEDDEEYELSEDDDYDVYEEGIDGEEGWTNSDGDRLRDYGVDEESEIIADDDIPLGELLRRRRAHT